MRIISWNIAALPYPFNHFKNDDERIKNIINIINQLDADIICLQEVFDTKVKLEICRGLYNYKCFTSNANTCFGLNGGLLTAIRNDYIVISKLFYRFKNSTGEDRFGNKGILKLTLNINGKLLSIYNTHLQANAKYCCFGDNVKIRNKQLEELKSFIDNNDKIICGDFNTNYNIIMNYILYYNPLPINLNLKTTTWNDTVDFIFVYLNDIQTVSNYDVNKTQVSDHYIVKIDFEILH